MGVQIPPVLVLIVCKTILAGPPDQNAAFTHWENLRMGDAALDDGVPAQRDSALRPGGRHEAQSGRRSRAAAQSEFRRNFGQCARAGIRLAMDWDDAHRNTPWRVWRVGCPSPIVDTRTGTVIGYKLPECGHRDTVICEIGFRDLARRT